MFFFTSVFYNFIFLYFHNNILSLLKLQIIQVQDWPAANVELNITVLIMIVILTLM